MKKKYTAAIVGDSAFNNSISELSDFGYRVFFLPHSKRLEPAISSHADLSLFMLKDRIFVSKDYYSDNKELIDEICVFASRDLVLTDTSPHSPYPYDVPFCALNCSDNIVIANVRALASEISEACLEYSIPIVNTRQGYAKCTSLYFDGCLVSADPSTLKAASDASLRTLEISRGGIDLPGYSYGFIGGCSGFDGENIYFCGTLDSHPDADRIKTFARATGVGTVSLGEHSLCDIGSIFFL